MKQCLVFRILFFVYRENNKTFRASVICCLCRETASLYIDNIRRFSIYSFAIINNRFDSQYRIGPIHQDYQGAREPSNFTYVTLSFNMSLRSVYLLKHTHNESIYTCICS